MLIKLSIFVDTTFKAAAENRHVIPFSAYLIVDVNSGSPSRLQSPKSNLDRSPLMTYA